MKLVHTDNAIEDLERLREFIAVHNPSLAGKVATELVSKTELLPDFPGMGKTVEMAPVPDSIRHMVFGKYVVRYSVHVSAIIILRIEVTPSRTAQVKVQMTGGHYERRSTHQTLDSQAQVSVGD